MDSYTTKRGQLEAYFDRTAAETWARLTSDAPVSRIRQTVRAGRDEMRAELLARLPQDLAGARVLDAGCGAGQMAVALASRGAEVVAVDISPKLLRVAEERTPQELKAQITYLAGDMLDERHGHFDHVIAMDSLIHYAPLDILGALRRLTPRVTGSIAFTVAPRTPALAAMHRLGKLFPRADRSPAIHPVGARHLTRLITESLPGWRAHETRRIARGFYISEAWELAR